METLEPEITEGPVAVEEPKTWRDKYLKNWMETRLAYEAFMLGKIQKEQDYAFETAKRAADGTLGTAGGEGGGDDGGRSPGEEEMGSSVSVGNTYNYQIADKSSQDKSLSADISSKSFTPVSDTASKLPTWLKASLLGLGGTAGGLLGAYAFSSPTPDSPPAMVDTDTDTRSKVTIKR